MYRPDVNPEPIDADALRPGVEQPHEQRKMQWREIDGLPIDLALERAQCANAPARHGRRLVRSGEALGHRRRARCGLEDSAEWRGEALEQGFWKRCGALDEGFLRTYCPSVTTAIDRICEWIAGEKNRTG